MRLSVLIFWTLMVRNAVAGLFYGLTEQLNTSRRWGIEVIAEADTIRFELVVEVIRIRCKCSREIDEIEHSRVGAAKIHVENSPSTLQFGAKSHSTRTCSPAGYQANYQNNYLQCPA